MIKLTGNLFKRAMEYNHIVLKDGIMSIHNTDNKGYGYQQKIKPIGIDMTSELNMILSKKDYVTLSRFEDFNITQENDIIKIETKHGKLKLPNMIDVHLSVPEIKDMQSSNITASNLMRAVAFCGNDTVKIQTQGVCVHDDQIVASNSKEMYLRSVDSKLKCSVNVPKEVFKYLDPGYKLLANEKMAVFMGQGEAFYTTVIEQKHKKYNETFAASAYFDLDLCEFINGLQLIKNYSEIVDFVYKGDVLHLLSNEEMSNIDITITPEKTDCHKLNGRLVVKDLLLIASLSKERTIKLHMSDVMCFTKNEEMEEIAATMAYGKKMEVE